ncbi:uncharacterized protein [Palaemon carinicauda]|uniref:uncharacterized protein n=1 Tax=Palaemon carinicauda TaxID=392227 RepID=UPI0035B66946
MWTESVLFDQYDRTSLLTCFNAMKFSFLAFSKIHGPHVMGQQVPNAHETYLPMSLVRGPEDDVNVNDLFNTDFSWDRGTYDPVEGIHKPKVFVIYGAEGYGKTSLLNYLLYQFLIDDAKDVKNIKNFDLAIIANLKEVKDSKALSLLKSRLPLSYLPNLTKFEDIQSELQQSKILWLFDSFETAPVVAKAVLKDAIQNFPASQVVLTSHWKKELQIRELMELTQAKNAPLHMMPLTKSNWRLMVPKMAAAKTYDPRLIEVISRQFIEALSAVFDDRAVLNPKLLGYTFSAWLKVIHADVATCKVKPGRRGRSNQ